LGALESAPGRFDSVHMGGYHFGGSENCEAFLGTDAPKLSWRVFGNDMVYLLHRGSVDPATTADIISCDYNAKKSGFPTMGAAFTYASMQQPLPTPFAGMTSAAKEGKEPSPLPAIRTFESWMVRVV
jgi:hypothetical protein